MKKMNTKGFTLIELLAVIVILAVIALIATPMILGVIDTAKKGATESSGLGYIDAVEKATILSLFDDEVSGSTTFTSNKVYTVAELDTNGVTVKGEEPTAGWVAIDSTGVVVAAQLTFESYTKTVRYDGNKAYADITTIAATPTDVTAAQALVTTAN
ncbi:MAG: type II secretion system protein [Bacilli bacterium]